MNTMDSSLSMNKIITWIIVWILAFIGGYFFGQYRYNAGYKAGYNVAYGKGYTDGYADKGKLTDNSTVKTETKIVYEKIPYNGNDVQITTPPPTVKVSVNGKQQEVKQKTETADLQVKTDTEVKIKIPERKWKIGLGTDGKKMSYMLSTPAPFVKNEAVGLWIAGTGREKIMGGVSISF